ncbi:MAG: formylglycine-generating enzyme family protein [Nitrospinae bacterium]|nr:formylglycine-generating enzyme family protein [Nitrospinota bacterium]
MKKYAFLSLLFLSLFYLSFNSYDFAHAGEKPAKAAQNKGKAKKSSKGNAMEAMVTVPAGNFTMGSKEGEGEPDEMPQHTHYLDAFYIDKYEVTNAQFQEFRKNGGYEKKEYWSKDGWAWKEKYKIDRPLFWGKADLAYSKDRFSNQDNTPVVGVAKYEAEAYCASQGKRLPTEAEWEKAARGASDGRLYSWGNEAPDEGGVYRANYNPAANSAADGYKFTAPVGSFENGKSPYGAYDMVGNVFEWTGDLYSETSYSNHNEKGHVPPTSSDSFTPRGGSWKYDQFRVRVSNRCNDPADVRKSDIGFRCAMSK